MRLRHIKEADPAIQESEYCISDYDKVKGNWNSIFGNDNPIELEIGMGKGRFIMELAKRNPDKNFVGMERYSSVLYRALQKVEAMEEKPTNLRFICEDARLLPDIFEKNEISKVYLNFSDPWPKDRHAKRRLTSHTFLDVYAKVLEPGREIHFKTDNRDLFDFSVESIKEYNGFELEAVTYDLHNDSVLNNGNIMTEYEEKFSSKGQAICKLIAERS